MLFLREYIKQAGFNGLIIQGRKLKDGITAAVVFNPITPTVSSGGAYE